MQLAIILAAGMPSIENMVWLLFKMVVVGVILWAIWYIFTNWIPLPLPVRYLILAVVGIICLYWLITVLLKFI